MCGSQNRQILPIDGEGLITPSLETDALAVKLRNSGALFPLLPRITEYAEPPYMGEIVTTLSCQAIPPCTCSMYSVQRAHRFSHKVAGTPQMLVLVHTPFAS